MVEIISYTFLSYIMSYKLLIYGKLRQKKAKFSMDGKLYQKLVIVCCLTQLDGQFMTIRSVIFDIELSYNKRL